MRVNLLPFIFILLVLTKSYARSGDFKCALPLNMTEISDESAKGTVKEKLADGDAFLLSIAKHVNFEIPVSAVTISTMDTIGRNKEIDSFSRSEGYRIAAGIYGRISDKLRNREGGICGGISIRLLRRSLDLAPNNHYSVIGLSKAMQGICLATAKYPKKFIELGAKVNITSEASVAQDYLNKLPETEKHIEAIGDLAELKAHLLKCARGESLASEGNHGINF